MTLEVSIDKQIDLMVKWKIDANQWFLIQLLYVSQQEGNSKYLYKYFDQAGRGKIVISGPAMTDLVNKGILKSFDESGKFFYEDLELESKFQREVFVEADVAGMELWEAFPRERSYRMDPTRPLLTKKLGNHFATLEDFFRFYCKSIRYAKSTHKKILELIEKAEKANQIDFTIVEFVRDRIWEGLEIKTPERTTGKMV